VDQHAPARPSLLFQRWPRGSVALASWLHQQGISAKLTEEYCKRGWISPIAPDAYIRSDDTVGWPGAIFALQNAGWHVHPGGRTTLEIWDFAPRLPRATARIELFRTGDPELPAWIHDHNWGVPICCADGPLFNDPRLGLTLRQIGGLSLAVAPPERAILEVLASVHDEATFRDACALVRGLTKLRPGVMAAHLRACTSVIAKRLFLLLADEVRHVWRSHLMLAGVDLGKGQLSIVADGVLNTRYHIMVPDSPGTITGTRGGAR